MLKILALIYPYKVHALIYPYKVHALFSQLLFFKKLNTFVYSNLL